MLVVWFVMNSVVVGMVGVLVVYFCALCFVVVLNVISVLYYTLTNLSE